MKFHLPVIATLIFGCGVARPAIAQLSPSGSGNPSGISNPTSLQPRGPAPDIAPPALPGAQIPAPATGPVVQKPVTGDPTTALFAAINSADYNAAQDAVSRGADINVQNSLGETPLDLSIALNHNTITFMLLSARNESGENAAPSVGAAVPAAVPSTAVSRLKSHRLHATPAKAVISRYHVATPAAPVYDPGTPNPAAGFLGFGPAK